jgi:hypothetical protein
MAAARALLPTPAAMATCPTRRAYVAALHRAASAADRSRRAGDHRPNHAPARAALGALRMPEPSPLVTIGDGDS